MHKGCAATFAEASGATSLSATNNLNLKTVQTGERNNIKWNADNHLNYGNTQEVGSQISGGGSIKLSAGNDINARAANVQAKDALSVNATGSVNIVAGQNTSNLDEAHKTTGKGFMSKTTVTTRETRNSSTAQASNFGGGTVSIDAGKDIRVLGSNVIGDGATTLVAKNNVTIEAAQNTSSSNSYRQESKSGLMSGGGIGVSYGKQKQSIDGQEQSTTAAASTTTAGISGEAVLGHTPSAAARAVALIDLSGGWDAFVARLKIDLLASNNGANK